MIQIKASIKKEHKTFYILWGVHKLCHLGRGQPKRLFTTQTLLNKEDKKGEKGSKIADFETTQFMDGPYVVCKQLNFWSLYTRSIVQTFKFTLYVMRWSYDCVNFENAFRFCFLNPQVPEELIIG